MLNRKGIFIIIPFLIAMIISIIILRNYVFEIAIVSGQSMEPAIMGGDYILINRLAYKSQEPKIGDVIAIKFGYVMMVKRVIGTPGDVIEIKNGYLYRNSKLANSKQLNIPEKIRKHPKTIKIWDKHLYVIGDNIEHSEDSRLFGSITYNAIVGKVILVYYPFGRMRKIKDR